MAAVITVSPSIPLSAASPPWQATLREVATLLEAVPEAHLTLDVLVRAHWMLVPATNPYRGKVRDTPGAIRLDGHVLRELPAAGEARAMLADSLGDLRAALRTGVAEQNPVATASEAFVRLTAAHPFVDGNGRVARAVANWLLERAGFSVVADPGRYCRNRKSLYYRALALRQGVPPQRYDAGPWDEFYAGLVAETYRPVGHSA